MEDEKFDYKIKDDKIFKVIKILSRKKEWIRNMKYCIFFLSQHHFKFQKNSDVYYALTKRQLRKYCEEINE